MSAFLSDEDEKAVLEALRDAGRLARRIERHREATAPISAMADACARKIFFAEWTIFSAPEHETAPPPPA